MPPVGRFTVGYIVSVGIAAVIFILFLKWFGNRFPGVPVVDSVGRAL